LTEEGETLPSSAAHRQQEAGWYKNNFRKIIPHLGCEPHLQSPAIFFSDAGQKRRMLLHTELRAEPGHDVLQAVCLKHQVLKLLACLLLDQKFATHKHNSKAKKCWLSGLVTPISNIFLNLSHIKFNLFSKCQTHKKNRQKN